LPDRFGRIDKNWASLRKDPRAASFTLPMHPGLKKQGSVIGTIASQKSPANPL
jgi:hypothetical protein